MSDERIATSHGEIAWTTSAGDGPTLLLIHGNSSSSEVFRHQMNGSIGDRYRCIAMDLPGHGASDDALDPERTYSIPGYADVAIELMEALGQTRYTVLGWSLGGHIGLDMLTKSQAPNGLMISGTPPIGRGGSSVAAGFTTHPHVASAGSEHMSEEDIHNYARTTCGAAAPYEPFMEQTVRRTDGRARKLMFDKLIAGYGADQRAIATASPVPLAIVNGADDALVRNDYIAGLEYENLWEDTVHLLPGLDHAPFWESPNTFNPYLERFLSDLHDGRS